MFENIENLSIYQFTKFYHSCYAEPMYTSKIQYILIKKSLIFSKVKLLKD